MHDKWAINDSSFSEIRILKRFLAVLKTHQCNMDKIITSVIFGSLFILEIIILSSFKTDYLKGNVNLFFYKWEEIKKNSINRLLWKLTQPLCRHQLFFLLVRVWSDVTHIHRASGSHRLIACCWYSVEVAGSYRRNATFARATRYLRLTESYCSRLTPNAD